MTGLRLWYVTPLLAIVLSVISYLPTIEEIRYVLELYLPG